MKEKLTRSSGLITVSIALGILLGAVWTRAQPVSPVRIGDDPPALGVEVDGGPLTLDADVTTATSPIEGFRVVVVPTSRIRDRCGDGDGCRVRLFLSAADGSTLAAKTMTRLFSVTAIPTFWQVHDQDGNVEANGDATDDITTPALTIGLDDRICQFRDDGITFGFRLVASNVTPQEPSNCVLRIDD